MQSMIPEDPSAQNRSRQARAFVGDVTVSIS